MSKNSVGNFFHLSSSSLSGNDDLQAACCVEYGEPHSDLEGGGRHLPAHRYQRAGQTKQVQFGQDTVDWE